MTTKKAVFMMGGPAAGKSTVRKNQYADLMAIDCDAIKASHPEYDPKNPSILHEWSSAEAYSMTLKAIANGDSFVFDGTGSTAEKYVHFIRLAQAAGFTTEICYVTVDLKTALARNAARERTVAESIVREKHSMIATSFEIVSRYADAVTVINN